MNSFSSDKFLAINNFVLSEKPDRRGRRCRSTRLTYEDMAIWCITSLAIEGSLRVLNSAEGKGEIALYSLWTPGKSSQESRRRHPTAHLYAMKVSDSWGRRALSSLDPRTKV